MYFRWSIDIYKHHIHLGFAQLTYRFLGHHCLAKGLNGIDQLFLHYSHADTVLLFLITLALVLNHSMKMS